MSKNGLRGFASGILFATSIIAGNYYFFDEKRHTAKEIEQSENEKIPFEELLQNHLETNRLVVISSEEYEQLKSLQEKGKKELEQVTSNQLSKTENQVHRYTLVVNEGMNGVEIAEKLKEANIIENEEEFVKYLMNQKLGYSLRVGTYELNNQMSFADIGKVITKRQ